MTSGDASPAQLRRNLLTSLPPPAREAVSAIVAAAPPGVDAFAVGGAVRDLLIGTDIVDIDLVTEDDAPTLLRRALPYAKLTVHARFRTASAISGGIRIDLATARTETYAHPGALPRVSPARIDADLRRRDFSINAVALRLSGTAALLDPCGGTGDIANRRIRVLHDASFRDDPTRIFRALRYAARLAFEVEPQTASLLARDIHHINAVGGERIRREIELMLGESNAGAMLESAHRHGVLAQVQPSLSWDDVRSAALATPPLRPQWLPYGFSLLAAAASADEAAAIVTRLKLKHDEAAAVTAISALHNAAHLLRRPDAKPSGVVIVLDRFPLAAVVAWWALESDPIARQLALRYLEVWRHVKPLLHGDELIELGVPAGPQVQRGLQLIRAARLDGWASDRDDERALALRFAKSIRDSGADRAPIEFNLN
jgi:tRNA nucleotidyltransferase (CCA-adding enzyme)